MQLKYVLNMFKKQFSFLFSFKLCIARLAPINKSSNHQSRTSPDDHYRAVCRALAAESLELAVFLQKVLTGDSGTLQLKEAQTSAKELQKLSFSEWVSKLYLLNIEFDNLNTVWTEWTLPFV